MHQRPPALRTDRGIRGKHIVRNRTVCKDLVDIRRIRVAGKRTRTVHADDNDVFIFGIYRHKLAVRGAAFFADRACFTGGRAARAAFSGDVATDATGLCVKAIINVIVTNGVIVATYSATARHVTFARFGIPIVRIGIFCGVFGATLFAYLTLLTARRAARAAFSGDVATDATGLCVKAIVNVIVANGVIVATYSVTVRHITFARFGIPIVRIGIFCSVFGMAVFADLAPLTARRAARAVAYCLMLADRADDLMLRVTDACYGGLTDMLTDDGAALFVTFACCGVPIVRIGIFCGVFGATLFADLALLTARRAARAVLGDGIITNAARGFMLSIADGGRAELSCMVAGYTAALNGAGTVYKGVGTDCTAALNGAGAAYKSVRVCISCGIFGMTFITNGAFLTGRCSA